MVKLPAVLFAPNEIAWNCTMSLGATDIVPIVTALSKDIRMVFASRMEKASTSTDPTPTFEPSKNMLQVVPSKRRISSSANGTPPTLPLLENEA